MSKTMTWGDITRKNAMVTDGDSSTPTGSSKAECHGGGSARRARRQQRRDARRKRLGASRAYAREREREGREEGQQVRRTLR